VPSKAALLLNSCPAVTAMGKGVVVKVWMYAEQPIVEPPFDPEQLHVHGPLPVTIGCVLVKVQRLVVGVDVNIPPFDDPQVPFTGPVVNVADTLFAEVMDTLQLPVPLHEPPQPPKLHPESGVAVKATDVPLV
jgi:hypothetical protein